MVAARPFAGHADREPDLTEGQARIRHCIAEATLGVITG
jgi:hypothetical protein